MEVLWDGKSSINWRDRGLMTLSQIKEDPQLKYIADHTVILITDGEFVYDFRYLESWKAEYGVEAEDPEEAFAECVRLRDLPKPTIESVSERIDGNDLALAELGSMAAANEAGNQELLLAIAEIGALVGGE